jgi:hypothetical protein
MKYQYIGKGLESGSIVLFYEQGAGVTLKSKTWASKDLEYSNCINEKVFKNITREYLANTYGKIESKEHAEFIAKLVEVAGIKFAGVGVTMENTKSFIFYPDSTFCFYKKDTGELVHARGREQITIPLPPKEPESKDWPQVGDEVLYNGSSSRFKSIKGAVSKVIAKYSFDGIDYITIKNESDGIFAMVFGSWIKKPKTPEEELSESILKFLESGKTYDRLAEAIIKGEIKGLTYKP